MNNYIYLVTVSIAFDGGTIVQKRQHAFNSYDDAKNKQLEYSKIYKSNESKVHYIEMKCLKVE